MAKKTKRDYQLGKAAKKMAHKYAFGKPLVIEAHMGRMAAACVDPTINARCYSGDTNQEHFRRAMEVLIAELPWNGLTPKLDRPFRACAEAALWLELKCRGKNPRVHAISAFNEKGHLAAPCANCALWVERAFGTIIKPTPHYEGRTKQRPVRYQN